MKSETAVKCVALVSAAFPSWRPTPETVRLYSKFLEPLDPALAERAIMEIIGEPREFAPPIGVIVDRIARLALGHAGPRLLPEEAWALVQDRIRYRGYYQGPGAVDAIVKRAIDAIGPDRFCTNAMSKQIAHISCGCITRSPTGRLQACAPESRAGGRLSKLSTRPKRPTTSRFRFPNW